jgi:hypothetical protein
MPRRPKPKKQWIIMCPEKTQQGWTWPQLEVREIAGIGRGLFAAANLAAGTCIPIIGLKISNEEFTHYYDGNIEPYVNYIIHKITSKTYVLMIDALGKDYNGRSITGLINEPIWPDKRKPNCIWKWDYVVVAQKIQKGQQLTISYGPSYRRAYKVNASVKSKCQYPALKGFPNAPPKPYDAIRDVVGTPECWEDPKP